MGKDADAEQGSEKNRAVGLAVSGMGIILWNNSAGNTNLLFLTSKLASYLTFSPQA